MCYWLRTYEGGQYAVNRVGRGFFIIENNSESLLGGIQPEPMRCVVGNSIDDGLIQRLLTIMLAAGTAGKDEPPKRNTGLRYNELVKQLHEQPYPTARLRFDDEALAIREELERKHLALMSCGIVNRKLAAHIGKYDDLFARLCLLWRCIEGDLEARGRFVTARTASRVAEFMHRFLLPHAAAFYNVWLRLADLACLALAWRSLLKVRIGIGNNRGKLARGLVQAANRLQNWRKRIGAP